MTLRSIGFLLLLMLCCTRVVTAASSITDALQRAPLFDPNITRFPECSLADFSTRLDAPAGKYGFVTVRDGHFYFPTRQRARFFGVNLAKDSVFIEKAQIDRLVLLFARAGINLVRIHHIDDVQGILDPDPARMFRSERLDLVDYWIAKLKARGIYVVLDLNDYRTFLAAEGVTDGEDLGRGAKPYAVFTPRLIELQQLYARKLLVDHINPYTKLNYAGDPAIAMLEIYDENGLFIRRGSWRSLNEPYQALLRREWHDWLEKRYGNDAALRAAWTNRAGHCALMPGESLAENSVQLPVMELGTAPKVNFLDELTAPVRQSAGVEFAADMQMRFLREMMTYLRKIGIQCPITAVGAQDVIPDLMATAAACDYIGINFYWDHPVWDAGNEWQFPTYFALYNPLVDNPDYSFPAVTSLARMHDRPLVVRELGYCSPNPYRGVGMLEAAAYGAFLDIDALVLFTYGADSRSSTIGFFDIHQDPLRWGIVAQAARLFTSGEVQPAQTTVGIGYSSTDAYTWSNYQSPLYRLAYSTRVVNYTDIAMPHTFNLLVSSGRSGDCRWWGERQLLFTNMLHADTQYQRYVAGPDELIGNAIKTGREGTINFTFRGYGFDAGTTRAVQASPVYALADLTAKGYQPVATAGTAAYGFVDTHNQIIGFRNLRPELAVRVALDALHKWSGTPVSHVDYDRNRLVTDTGQITRDLRMQLLQVDTPTLQLLAGQFDATATSTSMLKLATTTPLGTLTAESLDGKALAESASVLVKMTSRARNDQAFYTTTPGSPKPYRFTGIGVPPIRTDGESAVKPTRVLLAGKLLLELYLQNGTWEYLLERDRALLYCDTGGIVVNLPEKPKLVRLYTYGETIEIAPTATRFTMPAGTRYAEIVWDRG